MTTTWLLLLLLMVSSQSIDSQPTTEDDQVCDGEHSIELKEEVSELRRDVQKMQLLLDNQQQLIQTMMNRSGKSYKQVVPSPQWLQWDNANSLPKLPFPLDDNCPHLM